MDITTATSYLAMMLRRISKFALGPLFAMFWRRIGTTWLFLIAETTLFALIPLMIGRAIDGLLSGEMQQLLELAILMFALLFVAVGRRIYDTRAYGSIRVTLGNQLNRRYPKLPVSARSARQDMARELVDFLEMQAPELLTALVQITTALILLWLFHPWLAGSAMIAAVVMVGIYGLSHKRFYNLNSNLNQQKERQVHILTASSGLAFARHLRALRRHEVRLSDTEAVVYGFIYAGLMAFLLFNLWFAAQLIAPSAGDIFSIVTYSTTFLEASIALPVALQAMTRLSEISSRINTDVSEET
ncbi:MAG: ABC transporter six-transmembrane domain-containing protein [Paracoccaceae bacterium]|jgi:ABC-type bacteriocin/lantibiotic exporter with double-glycine peptidase domain|nr:ABC transporter six-transmembrane domain-containing protein [Paracoccaceae bacterium]MDG1373405.1 ABC transporter six-transmembrane domain-containing protein [Paracoccaceae bacterium]